jgi:hypothetical protein
MRTARDGQAKFLELCRHGSRPGRGHKPGEAPWSDLRQTLSPGSLKNPFLEGRVSELLLQVKLGQDIQRKYIEDGPGHLAIPTGMLRGIALSVV